MTSKFNLIAIICCFATIFLAACGKDNSVGTGPEQINSVMLRLENVVTGIKLQYYVRDLDGKGGDPSVADVIPLELGQEYRFEIEIFNDNLGNNPPTDHTYEVMDEAETHLICYKSIGAAPLPSITDADGNGKPLGLEAAFTATTAGSGSLGVTLKHEPDKAVPDPCTSGKTDIDVIFGVHID